MEKWDVYDIHRKKIDKTVTRGDKLDKDTYHLIVHICIFNSKGEMLIQQRQPFKKGWSNMWDLTVGGSATAGDTSQDAAERELFEEIGLKLDFKDTRPHITINDDTVFNDIYIVEKDIDVEELKLQYEEVKAVKWATKEEIFKMIDNEEFIPYLKSFIQLLFDMKSRYGVRGKEVK